MSVFADRDIAREDAMSGSEVAVTGRVSIDRATGPISYQPASVDLHLDSEFLKMEQQGQSVLVDDPDTYPEYERVSVAMETYYSMEPDDFVLAVTEEQVTLDETVIGYLWGRSSVGRLGIRVHNAGLVDPGFAGQLVLELRNETPNTIGLKPGMRVCQLSVHELSQSADVDYGTKSDAKYQSQHSVVPSHLWDDFTED